MIWALLAWGFAGLPAGGQEVGQTAADVRQALGNPSMIRHTGDREIWVYSNGTWVTMANNVVVAVRGAPPATGGIVSNRPAPPQASGAIQVAPTATETPGGVERTPSPAPAPRPSPSGTAESTDSLADETWDEGEPPVDAPLGAIGRGIGRWVAIAGIIIALFCQWQIGSFLRHEDFFYRLAIKMIPFGNLYYAFRNWSITKHLISLQYLVGIPMVILGGWLMGWSA